ncbi:MAG: NAD(P)H-quinone oxidoreductase [Deltaproteobacteria bacterium]|nr:NAD(P)H-quinone oxidoreductase [Deltaproteobacteria bacterium]
MKFVEVAAPGGPESLALSVGPLPTPGAGDVLIRVLAAGVNRPDIMQRQGKYPPPPGASPILGLEVAGEIAGLGAGVSSWKLGDRVCALTNGGGYAEYVCVPAPQCLPWPRGYDAVRAAALPETYFTVWANLFAIGRLTRGETVLIHGGSSGIGVTAIQLAREFGARVFATAGSDEKCAACVKLGAEAAINYRTADFETEIQRLTNGVGVNAILDMVGAAYLPKNLKCLAFGGRLILIGTLKGAKADEFDIGAVIRRSLTVTGSAMRPRSTAEKGALADALREKVWPILDAGRCGPVIDRVFPLAEVAAAHQRIESGAHIGKVVLKVAASD